VKERLIYNQSALCEKKNVDKKTDMRYKSHMDIGKVLRELIVKEGRSFRQTSIDLKVDRSTLHRSLKKGNPEWKTIEKVLDYIGYKILIVKKKTFKRAMEKSK
jgi:DNA-binding phage protein